MTVREVLKMLLENVKDLEQECYVRIVQRDEENVIMHDKIASITSITFPEGRLVIEQKEVEKYKWYRVR